jgi:class 3 adenylate cyclase
VTCPRCARELSGDFSFCPYCGAALADAPRGREERKVVTVLFADLVGFTARAERLDPEDVRGLLAPYHAYLRSELERFGGTVEKFIGDAVMALFGAPAAHEDDPERGVRAALAIRDWARERGGGLQVRIAVNTGEALVSLDARPGEGESMAAGDVVNTAARLQGAAPLNGVLVGEQTFRATTHAIEYREADAVLAKGKAEPVSAWEAVAARSRVGVEVTQQPAAPLVGRARELDLLVSTLGRVCEDRAPQLVTLVGVPGIGKSRLVGELYQTADRETEIVRWRQGRSLPYGEGVTFWALAEIVKADAGILETDSPEQTRGKLEQAVGRLQLDAREAEWIERHLGVLAGLAEAGEAGQDEAFAAWRRYLEALAARRPTVLVFEDLHWADDALLDFVDALVERAAAVPLLVVATARPELLQRRPGWGGGKANALTISLSPLSDDEVERLVHALLPDVAPDARTQEALLARVGGNPLYAEQYTRAMLERGELLELPETVQGIIAARLDALADEEKRLLQAAAVVGKVFWLGALEVVDELTRWQAEELLHALERKEFVQRSRSSSVASESEYAFRHVLIRDVAYGQIPRAARSTLHRRAAGWLESLGRPDEQAELLAHHYLQALELAEAARLDTAELASSARRALRDAGDRAAALHAVDAAERFYDAALRLSPAADHERAELLLRRAVPAGHHVGGGDPELLTEARDALLASGDEAAAAEAEMLLAQAFWIRGERDLYDVHAARALALAGAAPPTQATVWILARLATRASIMGEHARALELASEARAAAERLGSDEGLSEVFGLLGMERLHGGDTGGIEDLERGVEQAGASRMLGVLARARNTLAVGHQIAGDLEAAYAARLAAAEVGSRIGSASLERWFQGVLADHRYRRGDWDEARQMVADFLAAAEAGSPHLLEYQVYGTRAVMRLASGDTGGAVADAEAALAAGRTVAEVQAVSFALPLAAHVLAAAGEAARALEPAHELLDLLRGGVTMQFGVINLPLFTVAAVRLGLDGDLAEALERQPRTRWTDAARAYLAGELLEAADLLRLAGARPDEAEARLRAAERLLGEGRRLEGEEQLAAARSFYASVGARAYLEQCGDAGAQASRGAGSQSRGGWSGG